MAQPNDVEIPSGEAPAEVSTAPAKKGMSVYLKLSLGTAAVAIAASALFMQRNHLAGVAVSDVKTPPALDATPGGQNQANNPHLQRMIEQANDFEADRAQQSGQTFMPTPENMLKPITDLEEDTIRVADAPTQTTQPATPPVTVERPPVVTVMPPAAAPVRQRAQVETGNPNQEEPANPYMDPIAGQMGQLANLTPVRTMMVQDTRSPMRDAQLAAEAMKAEQEAARLAQAAEAPVGSGGSQALITAGTVIYGETITSSNSDLPGPVLVRVTAGKHKGASLVGSYQIGDNDPRMIIQFSSMTLADGTSMSINAYAVDGYTAETAVRSDINRRYIARYAPILAASFITGYAGARADRASDVIYDNNGNAITSNSAADAKQSLFAGVAAAAEAIGSDIMESAPKGPLVKLRAGYPIGILFVDNATGEALDRPAFTRETQIPVGNQLGELTSGEIELVRQARTNN